MTLNYSDNSLREAYDYCIEVTRRAARNFYYGIRLLPRERFASLCALYAFCRELDDAADSEIPHEELFARRRVLVAGEKLANAFSRKIGSQTPPYPPAISLPLSPPRAGGKSESPPVHGGIKGDHARGDTRRVVHGGTQGESSNNSTKCQQSDITRNGISSNKIEFAFTDTMVKYQLPRDALTRLIHTVESDLTPRLYETMNEVKDYARGVASTVGLCSVHIFGVADGSADDFAEALGIALQWTNILRDIEEDHRRGRCYLPLSNIREFNLTVEDLLAGKKEDKIRLWWDEAVEQGREFFHAAGKAFPKSKRRQLRPALAMAAVYRLLLEKMAHRPVHPPHIHPARKLWSVCATLTGLWNPFK